MEQNKQNLATQIHRLAMDLSDAGMTLGEPAHFRHTAEEVDRIAQQLMALSREIRLASSGSAMKKTMATQGALALKS